MLPKQRVSMDDGSATVSVHHVEMLLVHAVGASCIDTDVRSETWHGRLCMAFPCTPSCLDQNETWRRRLGACPVLALGLPCASVLAHCLLRRAQGQASSGRRRPR